jgi:FKBP-type peptidyl-prolyl cis-trans isomerase
MLSMKSKLSFLLAIVVSMMMVACNKEEAITGTEEEQIEAYIKSKGLTITEKTASGLRYILTKANTAGASLKAGQIVTVKYAGRLLSDKSFDSGTFSFNLGVGQVVTGFDEGIAKMKVGEKATLIFPSSLGYGSRGAGADIPAYSPLVFDIEVVSAK